MEYFKLVESGVDTGPYLDEITTNSELWYVDTSRPCGSRESRLQGETREAGAVQGRAVAHV
jgi:hypothetical protein